MPHARNKMNRHRTQSEQVKIFYTTMNTPIGKLYIGATEKGVCVITWNGASWEKYVRTVKNRYAAEFIRDAARLAPVKRELKGYFDGSIRRFSVDVDLFTVTPFQQKVLRRTGAIKWGTVKTYKDIAGEIGSPRAYRAVGNANGKNPAPLIIPCHRVVKSDGSLGGFGGGLSTKAFLLRHEGVFQK